MFYDDKMAPKVDFGPQVVSSWPWTLIIWPRNLISSSLHQIYTFGEFPPKEFVRHYAHKLLGGTHAHMDAQTAQNMPPALM